MAKSKTALRKTATEVITRLRDLRATKREIESEISGVQAEGIELLRGLEVKSISFDDPEHDNVRISATLVEPVGLDIDEAKLKKRIGAQKWQKVSKRVLDRERLEAAVAEGLVDPKTVAACSYERPKNPYIRVNESVIKPKG